MAFYIFREMFHLSFKKKRKFNKEKCKIKVEMHIFDITFFFFASIYFNFRSVFIKYSIYIKYYFKFPASPHTATVLKAQTNSSTQPDIYK